MTREGTIESIRGVVRDVRAVKNRPPGSPWPHVANDLEFLLTELEAAEAALALAERKAEGAQLKAEQFGAVADDEYRKRRDLEDALAIAVGLKDASEAKNTALRAALALHAQELDNFHAVVKMARCSHENRTGGNDYHLCNDCGLMWDYRRESAQDGLVNFLKLQPLPSAAAPVKENP